MTAFALDTSAVVAWFLQEEPRWREINRMLEERDGDVILPAPALAEVIVTVRRRGIHASPEHITAMLSEKGVHTALLIEADLLRAAHLEEVSNRYPAKTHHRHEAARPVSLSLGDALILAVVERLGIPIYTIDRYWSEFANAGHTTADIVEL